MSMELLSVDRCWAPALARLVDQVCNRFEAAWKMASDGGRPSIEAFLSDTTEPERSVLLRELLEVELAYRQLAGDTPNSDDYRRRFPEHAVLLSELLPAVSETPVNGEDNERTGPNEEPAVNGAVASSHEVRAAGMESAVEPMPPPGEWPDIAGYEILGELDREETGVVYKARQIKLNRLVALKLIRDRGLARPERLTRFRIEAQALAGLQHPNIVPIYEVGEQNGLPYFSMEYVDGGSLSEMLAKQPLPARAVAELLETLARAMHAAHQRGIMHRQLKPANVLVSSAGAPKVIDFGLAKQLEEDLGQAPWGLNRGTPSYMAPEQARGRVKEIGPAADVYALGAILYEALTGRPPFRGESARETIEQVISQEPVPPGRLLPKLSRDLETICLKCLNKEPAKRYASAEALADDLRRYLNREPIKARPTPLWERTIKLVKRRPAVVAAIGLTTAALVLLALGGLYVGVCQHQELEKLKRFDELRIKVPNLVIRGQEANSLQPLREVRDELHSVLGEIGDEPSLDEVKGQAEAALAKIEQRLAEMQGDDRADRRYRDFVNLRNEAMFHDSGFTGLDLPNNRKQTRKAAESALRQFGLVVDAPTAWTLDEPYLKDWQKREVIDGCYELLLVWAEAVAQPLSGEDPDTQARAALQILVRADQLPHPLTRTLHLRRANYYNQLRNQIGRDRELRQVAALQGKPAGAADHFLLGLEQYKRQHLTEAIHQFDSALQIQANHFWAQYFLAISYLSVQPARLIEARASLTACANQQPNFVWVYLLRGFARGEMGARLQMERRNRDAAREFQFAEDDFQKAEALQPDEQARYTLLVNRGVLRYRQRRFSESVADLQAAIRLQPNQFPAYANLARAFQEQRQLDDAVAPLNEALRLQPKLTALYRSRARLQMQRQDLSAARDDLDKAIQLEEGRRQKADGLEPFESQALAEDYTELGRVLFKEHQYEAALQACAAALQVDPDHSRAYRLKATTLLELNRYPEAVRAFDECLEKSRPTAELLEARGIAREKLRDYAGAIEDYTQALMLNPNTALLHAHRGRAYLQGGDSPKLALKDFQKWVELQPEAGEAYFGRGYAQVKLGDYRKAVLDGDEALRQGPRDARLMCNVARLYAQAAVKVEADTKERFQRELSARYGAKSVELLGQALQVTPTDQREKFWRDQVQRDPAFDPIRKSSGYAKLRVTVSPQKTK